MHGQFLLASVLVGFLATAAPAQSVVIGCKKDVEGQLLGEIMAQLLEDRGFTVERKFPLGGTLICFEALKNGHVDAYPEYTGTIEQAILRLPQRASRTQLRELLRTRYNLDLLDSFGFSNSYALAVSRETAEKHGLKRISQLASLSALRFGFSNEFLNRPDGWIGLRQTYGLGAEPVGIEHGLAYQAIRSGKLDLTDVYSTDGDIRRFDLVLLEDDHRFFPPYLAAPLARAGLDDRAKRVLEELAGRSNEAEMQAFNQSVHEGASFADVAMRFLREKGLLTGERPGAGPGSVRGAIDWKLILSCTIRHVQLTLIALAGAIIVAIPLGVLVYRLRGLARPITYLAGVLQTIPSLALLAFMIPIFNIGVKPAVAALFLYSLLPILRNTTAALQAVDPVLKKVSTGMGLTAWQRLRHVELPLGAGTILAGIKTAAIINIGTATLAAFIGAGGLGAPIATGLALNDSGLILQGAVPAALLAVLTELAFEGLERLLVPRHLLQNATPARR